MLGFTETDRKLDQGPRSDFKLGGGAEQRWKEVSWGSRGLRPTTFLRPRPLYRWKTPISKQSCHFTPIFIHSSLPKRFQ